jgi:hypothetical protein
MASNAEIAGVGPDAVAEKKRDDTQNDLETGSMHIEPAPPSYLDDQDAEQKDESEEINYHTLNWWYVPAARSRRLGPGI